MIAAFKRFVAMAATASCALWGASCSTDSSGSGNGKVQIFVVPEETITTGIAAGDGDEDVLDGWSIEYTRFLVTIGNFRARRSDDGAILSDPSTYILDLKAAPKSGYVTTELTGVATARWDRFGYDLPNAKRGAKALPPTTERDASLMIENGYSVYFEGKATKNDKVISFRWGFAAGTSFDDCASPDEIPGFAVPSGGTVQIKPTIHGDHIFFDNLTQGVEITKRFGGWLETCDANHDADLSIAELKTCRAVVALPMPPYDLTGVHDEDRDGRISVYDFVASQLRTLGDFQGDGECPTRAPSE